MKHKDITVYKVVRCDTEVTYPKGIITKHDILRSSYSTNWVEYKVGKFVRHPGSYLFAMLEKDDAIAYCQRISSPTLRIYCATMRNFLGYCWLPFMEPRFLVIEKFAAVEAGANLIPPARHPQDFIFTSSCIGRMIRLDVDVTEQLCPR